MSGYAFSRLTHPREVLWDDAPPPDRYLPARDAPLAPPTLGLALRARHLTAHRYAGRTYLDRAELAAFLTREGILA